MIWEVIKFMLFDCQLVRVRIVDLICFQVECQKTTEIYCSDFSWPAIYVAN